MAKVTIDWSGFPGGPGYTNLYLRDFTGSGAIDQTIVDSAVTKVDALLTAMRTRIPTTVITGVSPTIEAIEETDGSLQGFWTGSPAAPAGGGGGSAYSAPSGACISWYTSTVRNNRRIRGRTFIVPLATSAYEADGSLLGTFLTAMNTALTAFVGTGAAADAGVWARPSGPGATDGQWALTTSFRLPDKAAILTSRRD